MNSLTPSQNDNQIAIVGIAARFPGASKTDDFWRNLRSGAESVHFFSDEELRSEGVDEKTLKDPNYVKAAPTLEGFDLFDAAFFNYSPEEATAMDPQHRLFLECAWEAMEDAGYTSQKYDGEIGVYAGCGGSVTSYLLEYVKERPELIGKTGGYQHLGNDKDFLATHASFKLNLKGPSISVQTACSTSLVAVHLACEGILNGECDMALAGGISIRVPHRVGYFRMEGDMLSSDGHCRAFDEKADGIIFASGIGIVALKPLADALKDNDHIYAVIKGTAINNDGGAKISYTASSVEGQVRNIAAAFEISDVDPGTITYVEAHGTGTHLGDPVELLALTQAFRQYTNEKGFCAIGSVKSNIGHTDAAAGVAGLIKAALSLKYKEIPPSINFNHPNRRIDFKNSPFYVNTQLKDWPTGPFPRRAGVNSLGMGGTNAFAVLEEAPERREESIQKERSCHIITLSAKTEEALNELVERYKKYIQSQPKESFPDICFTANAGRADFSHRLAFVVASAEEFYEELNKVSSRQDSQNVFRGRTKGEEGPAAILGEEGDWRQRLRKLAEAYVRGAKIDWATFDRGYPRRRVALPSYPFQRKRYWISHQKPPSSLRKETDVGAPAEYLHPLLGFRVNSPLSPTQYESELSIFTQPFLKDHYIGKKIVFPMTGYLEMAVAAAGFLSNFKPLIIEDVFVQEALIFDQSGSQKSQVVVEAGAVRGQRFTLYSYNQEVEPPAWHVHATGSIKTLESPGSPNYTPEINFGEVKKHCHEPISVQDYYRTFEQRDMCFGASFKGISELWRGKEYALGQIQSATDLAPDSFSFQFHPAILDACFQVLFALFPKPPEDSQVPLLIPMGLERLSLHASPDKDKKLWSIAKLRTTSQIAPDTLMGDIWILGMKGELIAEVKGLRYKHSTQLITQAVEKQLPEESLTYRIDWQPKEGEQGPEAVGTALKGTALIFADHKGIGQQLAGLIQSSGAVPQPVYPGPNFDCRQSSIYVNPKSPADFERLIRSLSQTNQPISDIFHLWSLDCTLENDISPENLKIAQEVICASLLHLIQALVKERVEPLPRLWIVTQGAQKVGNQQKTMSLLQTPVWGLGNVINLELPNLRCTRMDIDFYKTPEEGADKLFSEIRQKDGEQQIAYRDKTRYVARLQRYSPQEEEEDSSRRKQIDPQSTYLITGGLGGIGLNLAKQLVRDGAKHLVLLDRYPPSEKAERELVKLRESGAEVRIAQADVSNPEEIADLFSQINKEGPPLKGIFHLAGALDDGVLIQQSWDRFEKVMAPKLIGGWNLHVLTRSIPLDFFIMFSSVASSLGIAGQGNYACANAFLDGLAHYRQLNHLPAQAFNWGPWEVGMAATLTRQDYQRWADQGILLLKLEKGLQMLKRLLNDSEPQIGIFSIQWAKYIQQFKEEYISPLFSRLVTWRQKEKVESGLPAPKPDLIQALSKLVPYKAKEQLTGLVSGEVCRVLSITDQDLDKTAPFTELGLDSLMSVQLRNNLSKSLTRELPATLFFDYPTLEKVVEYLLNEVAAEKRAK